MSPNRLFLILTLVPLGAFARDWQVDAAHSTLTFSASYQKEDFKGTFKHFDSTIRYDADDLSGSRFDVTVDLASTDTGSSERDDTLKGADFFDVSKFPKAHFVTDSFTRNADGSVTAKGQLTIREKTQPVTLQVKFVANGQTATLDVDSVLKRTEFSLGSSVDWVDVGADVPVHGHLVLAAK